MSEAIGGRWCGAAVWRGGRLDRFNEEPGGFRECGGELLYRRRLEGETLMTYLICQFCGAKTPMLACDTTTGEHADLTEAS